MRKYRFSVDGIPVTIYSALFGYERSELIEGLAEDELAVVLLPDLHADLRVEMFDKRNEEPKEPRLCFAALFCFFAKACSYPDTVLEIAYKDGVVPMDISAENEYKFSVKVGKRKSLGKGKIKFPDGIELTYHIIEGKTFALSVVCEDSDLFDKAALFRISELRKEYDARVALAISYSDSLRVKQEGRALPCEVIEAALEALSIEGISLKDGRHTAFISGREYVFSILGKDLIFYPHVKYLS